MAVLNNKKAKEPITEEPDKPKTRIRKIRTSHVVVHHPLASEPIEGATDGSMRTVQPSPTEFDGDRLDTMVNNNGVLTSEQNNKAIAHYNQYSWTKVITTHSEREEEVPVVNDDDDYDG